MPKENYGEATDEHFGITVPGCVISSCIPHLPYLLTRTSPLCICGVWGGFFSPHSVQGK